MIHPRLNDASIENLSRLIGDALVGTAVNRILEEAGMRPDPTHSTKWRRIDATLRAEQARSSSGNCALLLIQKAMLPQRWVGEKSAFEDLRQALNEALVYDGLSVMPDGQLAQRPAAKTHDQAAVVSRRLRDGMVARGGHREVFAYCSAELVDGDCFAAVFEAIKGLATRVRELSGLDLDTHELVAAAFEGSDPLLALNARRNSTELAEQRGIANLMKGLFSAFRNPPAHVAKVRWHVSEIDALDVLSTVSLIHRRLDTAVVLRTAA